MKSIWSLLWYDPETDGYQAAFRYYIPRLGRWLTPDPVGGDVTNPQSLNRYAYALNNPTSNIDPLGLGPCPISMIQSSNDRTAAAECGNPGGGGGGGGSCDPLIDPTCPCDPNEPSCSYPCIPEIDPSCNTPIGGGSGGGGGGRGGTTSLPGGMGNAGFGGLITCTQVTVVVNGVPYPSGPLQCTPNLPPWLLPFLQRPWMISWIIPMVGGAPPAFGVGPAGGFAFNPATHTLCGSLGIGASVGRTAAIGPMTAAKMWNGASAFPSGVNKILSGWSANGGINNAIGVGSTGMINRTGVAAGPTFGVPGVSIAATDSACIDLP